MISEDDDVVGRHDGTGAVEQQLGLECRIAGERQVDDVELGETRLQQPWNRLFVVQAPAEHGRVALDEHTPHRSAGPVRSDPVSELIHGQPEAMARAAVLLCDVISAWIQAVAQDWIDAEQWAMIDRQIRFSMLPLGLRLQSLHQGGDRGSVRAKGFMQPREMPVEDVRGTRFDGQEDRADQQHPTHHGAQAFKMEPIGAGAGGCLPQLTLRRPDRRIACSGRGSQFFHGSARSMVSTTREANRFQVSGRSNRARGAAYKRCASVANDASISRIRCRLMAG